MRVCELHIFPPLPSRDPITMSETTASEAPEEVEKVKPAHSEKGVCKHWAQKGFCFYGADNECKFLHPVKEAPRVAAIGELESKGEDQTELLKAVKDVMTSADRGADVDAPRIKPCSSAAPRAAARRGSPKPSRTRSPTIHSTRPRGRRSRARTRTRSRRTLASAAPTSARRSDRP